MNNPTREQSEGFLKVKTMVRLVHRRIEIEPKRSRMKIYEEIGEIYDLSASSVRLRYAAWLKDGDDFLMPKLKGRKMGDGKFLSDEQEAEIRKLITDSTPDQLKMPFALWRRQAVQELIYSRYGIYLVITAIGKYLKKWGFTVQRPAVKKPGQRPAQVEAWLEKEYPEIQAQAKREDAMIWWGDETAVQNSPNQLAGYSPRGVTPIVTGPRKRIHLHMVSAVSNQGAVRFKVYHEAINIERFKDFLMKMIQDAGGRKILLVLDNLRVHHGKDLQPWLEENKHLIELKFLPAYSPELNPDEYLNRDMKSRMSNHTMTSNKEVMEGRVLNYMDYLERNKELVQSFFSYRHVRYAA
jgi:transposase